VTTTTTARYRAQTDPSIKTWHLGTEELGARCVCGTRLMTPDDERAFALKVPAGKRDYQTDPDVAKVTCGSCRRNREYAKATAAEPGANPPPPEPDLGRPGKPGGNAPPPEKAARPSRRRKATGDPRADRAAADLAAAADRAAVEPRRRPSRADRAHAKQEEDRARREAAAEAAE
jgi:hypothetical protein